jgi:hypothetical protein
MRLINGQGVHINKNGNTTQGTRFFSAKRTLTAAQSNNSDFYPLISFYVPTTEFPDFLFCIESVWTIHRDLDNWSSNDYRATWTGGDRRRGNMYWNSSSDRGWQEQSNGNTRWWYGNFFGDSGFFGAAAGETSIRMKSAMNATSVLTCQAEVFCTRWDLITSITYTTS